MAIKVSQLHPMGNKVLVRRAKADDRTAGGIIIPDTAKEKLTRGEVLAVGPGELRPDGSRTEIPMKKGDQILFGKYSGNEFECDGESLMFMSENEIYAVVDG